MSATRRSIPARRGCAALLALSLPLTQAPAPSAQSPEPEADAAPPVAALWRCEEGRGSFAAGRLTRNFLLRLSMDGGFLVEGRRAPDDLPFEAEGAWRLEPDGLIVAEGVEASGRLFRFRAYVVDIDRLDWRSADSDGPRFAECLRQP